MNDTDCTLYVLLYVDCDGDGFPETFDEAFLPPASKDGPSITWIDPFPGCTILGVAYVESHPNDCEPLIETDGCTTLFF